MADTYRLTPHETVTVSRNSPQVLEVEGTLGSGGSAPAAAPPPRPGRALRGARGRAARRVDGNERTLRAGDTLDVPARHGAQDVEPGGTPARALWRTTPLRAHARVVRSSSTGCSRHPRGTRWASQPDRARALLSEYDDVIRLAVGPTAVVGGVLSVLAAVGGGQP